jgi:peptide/nickel transport system ATP-binding protein
MNILEVRSLQKSFYDGKNNQIIHAVDNVSFCIKKGEFLGLVGESGCGKSTIARMVAGLLAPDCGQMMLNGKVLSASRYPKSVYKNLQMIFQDPQDSFDPRRTLGSSIAETQLNFGVNKADAHKNTLRLLDRVGLKPEMTKRYPHQVSGGECQRAAIARAISISPALLICDEITSALDVSVQAQISELLLSLQEDLNISLLFISHDLALVQGICDRVILMYAGKIVEEGTVSEVLQTPKHPVTKLLLSSVFPIDPDAAWEIPSLDAVI